MAVLPLSRRERLAALAARFNGPQTLGRSRPFWLGLAAVVLFALSYPLWGEPYGVANKAYLMTWVFLGLSVCLLWGYTGIVSFGQTAFFGLAGYSYGVMAINLLPVTNSTVIAVIGTLVLIGALAWFFGYIMFYGGVSSLYVAIFTLMLTLLAESFMSRTSGPRFEIGDASLGGSNGMIGIPPLQIGIGGHVVEFVGGAFYYLVLVLIVATYLALRLLLNSRWGYLMVATREDPDRTEMFGYDVRRIRLAVFVLAGCIAGLSGILFASWNNFISPSIMGMTAATLPLIWVAAGGRKSILAVIIATFILQWTNQELAYMGSEYSLLFFALLILATVMLFPEGIIPKLVDHAGSLAKRARDRGRRGSAPRRTGSSAP
ncbi:MAG: branched-chain amino acid ABC transporter permease [Azospirillaceae bacterium]